MPQRRGRLERVATGQLGRLPQDERLAPDGAGVVVDREHVLGGDADEARRGRGRVGRRRGRHGERRTGRPRCARDPGVVRGEPPQPTQDEGHVRPEHPAVRVPLVDDDVPQAPQQPGPALVVGEQREVQEVGVGEHDVGVLADPLAFLEAGVPVAGRDPQVDLGAAGSPAGRVEHALERGELVGGERLRGAQVEDGAASGGGLDPPRLQHRGGRPVTSVLPHGGQRRQPEGERLAGPGRRRQRHVPAVVQGLGGGGLVRPRPLDAELAVPGDELRVGPHRPVGPHALAGRQHLDVTHRLGAATPAEEHVEQRAGGTVGHGLDPT